ncbi:MAG: bacteriohemerythrin [Actinomycetota bacterium]
MKIITWTDDLSVGVGRIDDDHRRWIELFNALFAACFAGVGADVVRGTLAELVDYTKGHFAREEGYLAEVGYPGLEAHRQLHQALVVRVDAIMAELDGNPGREVSAEVLDFLQDWLIHHIKEQDLRYASATGTRPG